MRFFVVDVGREKIAMHEAKKLGVPVVAIVDTNCSPDSIEYVIPGNDDAMRAISLYAGGMAEAVLEGKASVPTVAVGEDEFVELDEAGQPKKKSARGRQRPQATVRKKALRAGGALPPGEGALPRWQAKRPGCGWSSMIWMMPMRAEVVGTVSRHRSEWWSRTGPHRDAESFVAMMRAVSEGRVMRNFE